METREKITTKKTLFSDIESAEAAYQALIKRGYKPEEISIIMSEGTQKKYCPAWLVTSDKSMEGLALGGALGGTILGVLAAIVSLYTAIFIPGPGLIILGPFAAGLIGVGAGSIIGGILGVFIGMFINEEHATVSEKGIKENSILLIVKKTTSAV